jgi:hypothetical protein
MNQIFSINFFWWNNIETSNSRRPETYDPIWTISDLYLPIVGYYDRAKFCADHFSRSGGGRLGENPECIV